MSIDTLLKGTIAEESIKEALSPVDQRQRNRNIRFVVAVILFIIAPFYPGSPGAGSASGFLMILSIAVGIGLLIYNHKTKDQEE